MTERRDTPRDDVAHWRYAMAMQIKNVGLSRAFAEMDGEDEARFAPLLLALLVPSEIGEKFIPIGRLHRPSGRLTGGTGVTELNFLQDAESIPLPVHAMLRVYRKEGEEAE